MDCRRECEKGGGGQGERGLRPHCAAPASHLRALRRRGKPRRDERLPHPRVGAPHAVHGLVQGQAAQRRRRGARHTGGPPC